MARVPLSKHKEITVRAHDEYNSDFEAHQYLSYIESRRRGMLGKEHDVEVGAIWANLLLTAIGP